MRIAALLLLGVAWAQQPPVPVPPPRPVTGKAVVAGVVVDSVTGLPVAGAKVDIQSIAGQRSFFTGPDGAFRFEQLPSGGFGLSAYRVGYSVGRYWDTRLGEEEKREGVRLKMPPLARITGVVLDEYDEPVNGCMVSTFTRNLMSRGRWQGRGQSMTNEDGEYTIQAPEGRYLLRLECTRPVVARIPFGAVEPGPPRQGLLYKPTFYPSSERMDGAQLLRLKPGEVKEQLNFRVKAVPAAAIVVANPVPQMNIQVEERGVEDVLDFSRMRGVGPQGYVGMFPAGQYTLTAMSLQAGQRNVAARGSVSLDGLEVKTVTLEPYTSREVTVQIVWDGPPAESFAPPRPNNPMLPLAVEESPMGYRPMTAGPNGSIRWTLNPGKHRFVPQGLPMWVVVTKVRMGSMVVEGDTATFRGDEEGDLEVTLSARAGMINLNPVWPDAEGQRSGGGQFRGIVVDGSGRFDYRRMFGGMDRMVLRLPPGRHELFLFSAAMMDTAPDVEVLRAARLGTQVVVEEGKSVQLDVRVIGEKDLEDAERTSGAPQQR